MKKIVASIVVGCMALAAAPAFAEKGMEQGMSGDSMEKPAPAKQKTKAKKHMAKDGMGKDPMAKDSMAKDPMARDPMGK